MTVKMEAPCSFTVFSVYRTECHNLENRILDTHFCEDLISKICFIYCNFRFNKLKKNVVNNIRTLLQTGLNKRVRFFMPGGGDEGYYGDRRLRYGMLNLLTYLNVCDTASKVHCVLLGCTKVDCAFEPCACNEMVTGPHFTSVARLRLGMSSCEGRKPMNLWNTRAVQTFPGA
jgi:hypothetical protein